MSFAVLGGWSSWWFGVGTVFARSSAFGDAFSLGTPFLGNAARRPRPAAVGGLIVYARQYIHSPIVAHLNGSTMHRALIALPSSTLRI